MTWLPRRKKNPTRSSVQDKSSDTWAYRPKFGMTSSPPILGRDDEDFGWSEEYIVHCLYLFGKRVYHWRTETGRRFQQVRVIEDDEFPGLLIKPGNIIVYRAEDFVPREYEPVEYEKTT